MRSLLDWLLTAAILGLLTLLAARLDRVDTRHVAGQFTINDGDTVTVSGERVRLRGIDAPEYNQQCRRGGRDYACGREAREALAALIGEYALTCSGWQRDRYGRLLAACAAGGRDLNAEMVKAGWAVAYGDFQAEENAARARGAGLWAGTFDRPQDWRANHGAVVEREHGRLAALASWFAQMFGF